jgi:hypothetical protein
VRSTFGGGSGGAGCGAGCGAAGGGVFLPHAIDMRTTAKTTARIDVRWRSVMIEFRLRAYGV